MDNLRLYLLFIFPIISIFFVCKVLSVIFHSSINSKVEWTALKQVKLKTLQKHNHKSIAVGGRVVRFSSAGKNNTFMVISRLTVLSEMLANTIGCGSE